MQDLNSDKKSKRQEFLNHLGTKLKCFSSEKKKKVKRKFVEEYLIDRTGRNFKSQFNARRKDLGDVFSTSSKFDQTKRKFRLNSTKFLAERSVQEKFLKMANPSIPTASK